MKGDGGKVAKPADLRSDLDDERDDMILTELLRRKDRNP